jgi:hypothetical protein
MPRPHRYFVITFTLAAVIATNGRGKPYHPMTQGYEGSVPIHGREGGSA